VDENTLDMRGRPSPEPLVEARRVIAAGEVRSFVVLLTDLRCAENLATLAATVRWSSRVERTTDGDLRVAMRARRPIAGSPLALTPRAADTDADADAEFEPLPPTSPTFGIPRTVVVIASQRIGDGELGEQLLRNLVLALPHTPQPPDALVLLNDGARLLDEASDLAASLEALARQGTTILVGAASVERLGLSDQMRFARPVAMTELATLLLAAERVVRL